MTTTSETLSELERLCLEHKQPFGDIIKLYFQTKDLMKEMRMYQPDFNPYTHYEKIVEQAAFLNTKYYITHGEGWSLPTDYIKQGNGERWWNQYKTSG